MAPSMCSRPSTEGATVTVCALIVDLPHRIRHGVGPQQAGLRDARERVVRPDPAADGSGAASLSRGPPGPADRDGRAMSCIVWTPPPELVGCLPADGEALRRDELRGEVQRRARVEHHRDGARRCRSPCPPRRRPLGPGTGPWRGSWRGRRCPAGPDPSTARPRHLPPAAWLADGPAVAGASVGAAVVGLGDGVAAVPPHAANRTVEATAIDAICRIGRR